MEKQIIGMQKHEMAVKGVKHERCIFRTQSHVQQSNPSSQIYIGNQ